MNYTKFFTMLFFALAMASCDFGSSSTTDKPNLPIGQTDDVNTITDTTEKPTAAKPETTDNWLVIPGEQVGRIKANFKGADFYKTFGENNVSESELGLGEGETKKGLVVFPNTSNELQVLFEGDEKMDKLETIRIQGEGSMWKTDSGIGMGTTLEELVKINGKDFKFYGFEWDYAGKLANWNGGKLNEKLIVYLEPTNEEAVFPALLGDKEFSSNNAKAKAAGLIVISMEVNF